MTSYDDWKTTDPHLSRDYFCRDCAFRNHDGVCLNHHSNEFEEIVDDEHCCSEWEEKDTSPY